MKNTYYIPFKIQAIFILFFFMTSCGDSNSPEDNIKSMRDLEVPDGFNYHTTEIVEVKIGIPEGVPWRTTYILSTDETDVFYKGMPTDSLNRLLEARISIPSYINEVILRYGDGTLCKTQVVEVNESGIVHEFVKEESFNKSVTSETDTDGDHVIDSEDDYPEDSSRAYNIFIPGGTASFKDNKVVQLWSTYAFEDLWPGYGDYDFNDLVVDFYYMVVVCNTWFHGQYIHELYATFKFRAIGAGMENGFGLELIGIPYDHIENVSWRYESGSWSDNFDELLSEGYITLEPNNVESDQEYAVMIMSDNVDNVLPNPGGSGFVNTVETDPYQPPVILEFHIEFPWLHRPYYGCSVPWWAYTWTTTALCYEDVNPFLIISGERGKEVHLADFPPTDLVNADYFDTQNDDSDPSSGRYYKSENNLPWGLDISYSLDYPSEKNEIIFAYPYFVDWAESGGIVHDDWYLPEYAEDEYIYHIPE